MLFRSAAGLLGAYLSAVCLLPALLNNLELRPAQWPLRLAERLVTLREKLLEHVRTPVLLALLIAFCAGGLVQLQSKNDIRQWVGAPQHLTDEAQTIARITGYQPTSQFFLVRAANQQQLLERQAALSERLEQLVNLDKLQGYLALDQLVSPPSQQEQVRAALNKLPQYWQPLLDLGVPLAALQTELQQLQTVPAEDIDAALAGPLGEPYRTLWLGATEDGVAAMTSLQEIGRAHV